MYPKYVFKYALNTYSYTLKVRTLIPQKYILLYPQK